MNKTIFFITGNPNKLKEFNQIIGDVSPFKIESKNIDLPEYQGEPEEIAREKCKTALEILNVPILVEDTSLCFNALKGKFFSENIK